ncbi:MAG: NUDIX hydrolase [Thermodesulfobacteriota bacterium]
MIKSWKRVHSKRLQSYRVFSIRADKAISPRTGKGHDFYIIESEDWVNIIPLTLDHQVVMIRQYRHGSREVTLEIPGGLVDSGDTPKKAACRELLEETGYQAQRVERIGVVNPNPAIFSNRCYTFLAKGVRKVANPTPDQTEDIEMILVPLKKIPNLILNGKIDNAMVITAFAHYFLRYPKDIL